MIIAIQWIDCGNGEWESAEGRFAILPNPKGFYVRDRIPLRPSQQHPALECASMTQQLESKVCKTADQCKRWAHERLELYWREPWA